MLDFTQLQPVTERIEFPSDMTAEEFMEYCAAYKHMGVQIERNPDGSIVMEPPTDYESGFFELEVASALKVWNQNQSIVKGQVAGPSSGFVLPNGAIRAADASWISFGQLGRFTKEERKKFLPACPEFVVELLSPSDSLKKTKTKMQEWIENGALLAWLIDPTQEKAWIYRADGTVDEIVSFEQVLSGEDILPGFVFDLGLLRFLFE